MKRKYVRGIAAAAIITFSLTSFTACAGSPKSSAKDTTAVSENTTSEKETETETETETEPIVSIDEENEQSIKLSRQKFADVLATLGMGYKWPDDTLVDEGDYSSVLNNEFSIFDIDGDGNEELIIAYTYTSNAGMKYEVYGYDVEKGALNSELKIYPAATHYSNGITIANESHNQTYSDVWPYQVYKYNVAEDKYDIIASVYAWDKSYSDKDYDGKPFPTDQDKDKDGIIYYVTENDTETIMDKTDYDAWYKKCVGDDDKIDLIWNTLEPKNYVEYTEEYLEMLKNTYLSNGGDVDNDLGVILQDNNLNIEEFEQAVKTKLNASCVDSGSDEYLTNCTVDGKNVFDIRKVDAGSVIYKEKYSDITMFGVYPGMSQAEAVTKIEEYGFYKNEYDCYVTGEAANNLMISMTIENGNVKDVQCRYYCGFAG